MLSMASLLRTLYLLVFVPHVWYIGVVAAIVLFTLMYRLNFLLVVVSQRLSERVGDMFPMRNPLKSTPWSVAQQR